MATNGTQVSTGRGGEFLVTHPYDIEPVELPELTIKIRDQMMREALFQEAADLTESALGYLMLGGNND